jgi:hypothetical protein
MPRRGAGRGGSIFRFLFYLLRLVGDECNRVRKWQRMPVSSVRVSWDFLRVGLRSSCWVLTDEVGGRNVAWFRIEQLLFSLLFIHLCFSAACGRRHTTDCGFRFALPRFQELADWSTFNRQLKLASGGLVHFPFLHFGEETAVLTCRFTLGRLPYCFFNGITNRWVCSFVRWM